MNVHMRSRVTLLALGFVCSVGCATSTTDLGPGDGDGGSGGAGGSGGGIGGSKGERRTLRAFRRTREDDPDKLAALAGMDEVFFCNSGCEANEAAIKLARRTGRSRIIAASSVADRCTKRASTGSACAGFLNNASCSVGRSPSRVVFGLARRSRERHHRAPPSD